MARSLELPNLAVKRPHGLVVALFLQKRKRLRLVPALGAKMHEKTAQFGVLGLILHGKDVAEL